VVVEKPFAPTSEEADQVIKVAKESGRILTVYQSKFAYTETSLTFSDRRYDNDYLTLKSLVNQSAFGDILEVQLHHDLTGNPWIQKMDQKRVTGNGMAYVAGSHAVDHALDLFGTPRTVTAWFRSFRGTPSDNEDSYHITLTYDSPLIVHVKTNAMSIMPRVLTHFVRGSSGSWLKFGSDPQVGQAIEGIEPGSVGYGEDPESRWGQLATKERFSEVQQKEGNLWVGKVRTIPGNWPGYYSDLVKAIKGSAPIKVNPETSRVGIRIIELAWQSVQEERTVEYSEFK
jgi:predicted dehydrogenase